MKQISKIIICLCAVLLIGATAYAGAEQSNDYTLAHTLIEKLTDGSVLPADSDVVVTRAEFVCTLMDALGISGSECSFEDVSQKHFAYKAIAAVEEMGLTQQKSMFYPDRPLTYQNAAEIAVGILGYNQKADYYGGYPTGYLRVAGELKLDSDMSGKQMTSENVYKFIFNILNSYPLETVRIKNNSVSYLPASYTLLYQFRKISYAEGVVAADEASGLTNPQNCEEKDAIKIDSFTYYGCNSDGLLGKNCGVYYTDDYKKTVVCISPYLNNIKKFEVRKYEEINNGSLIFNNDASKTERINLDGAYTVLYNRKATKNLDIDALIKNAESGFVEAIDNNSDGRYDVISVMSYKYAWVSAIDLIDGVIFDRISGQSIDFSDSELCIDVKILNGESFVDSDISEITQDSLIACALSEDGGALSIVICYNTIDATLSEVGETDGVKKAVADGSEYVINNFIYNFIKKPLGISGVFCLGVNSEIVAVSGAEKDMMYGYVMELKSENFFKTAWLLTENGKIENKKVSDNLKLDGVSVKTEEVWDELKDLFSSDDKYRVIRYKLKNDELAQIDTAQYVDGIVNFNELENPDDSLALYHEGTMNFNSGGAGFSPVFNIGGGTVSFVIPKADERGDISKYRIESSSFFADDNSYDLVAYDVGRNSIAGVILVIENETTRGVTVGSPSAVVSRIETVTDEEGNQVKALTLWEKGIFTRYFVADDCMGDIAAVEKGDIIRYTNVKNKIAYVAIDYSYSSDEISSSVTKAGAKLEFFKGRLFSVADGYCYVYTGDGEIKTPVSFSSLRNAKIAGVPTALVEIDSSGKIEVKNMPSDVVRDYFTAQNNADKIVIRQNYYSSQLNVIYRRLEK